MQLDKRKLKKEIENAKAIAELERKKRRFPGKYYHIINKQFVIFVNVHYLSFSYRQ